MDNSYFYKIATIVPIIKNGLLTAQLQILTQAQLIVIGKFQ